MRTAAYDVSMRGKGIFALVVAGLLAAPASAATSDVHISNFAFSPGTIQIQPGDTVTWHWDGPDLNHSVTSDAGQSESFDSDPSTSSPLHAPGDTFSHTFNTAGTFTYHCKVHSFMRGKIVVGNVAPPPSSGAAPALSRLRVSSGRRIRVTFTLSEAAKVTGKVTASRTGKRVAALKADGQAGSNRITVTRRLKPGSYKLTLTATDSAGRRSRAVSARFKVR